MLDFFQTIVRELCTGEELLTDNYSRTKIEIKDSSKNYHVYAEMDVSEICALKELLLSS
jgi:hypothetical protein